MTAKSELLAALVTFPFMKKNVFPAVPTVQFPIR
jgi:hypothetical protein